MDKLQAIVGKALGRFRAANEQWDSLARIEVVVAVEEAYSVHFTDETFQAILNLTSLQRALSEALHPSLIKCIVLDLDNTLWQGILGEDGIGGIKPNRQLQAEMLTLRQQGMLLAVASKNDEAEAWAVIEHHPDMLLRRQHFTAARIGWEPKPESLRAIAAELGFGVDALLFVDDDPHEREQVRQLCPEVDVRNPVGFRSDDLYATATDEDRRRGDMVADNANRDAARAQSGDMATYLKSLNQIVMWEVLMPSNINRAAQLCQRTNQFNLTLKRHEVADLGAIAHRQHVGIVLSVKDRFGDAGRVGFALAVPVLHDPKMWILDTFCLSCRVIGRNIETELLSALIDAIRNEGGHFLWGQYVPGPRNEPCADFLTNHGFGEAGCLDLEKAT